MIHQTKYRPDIDGLRAVAIILVVLFHAFPNSPLFKGGFIGVDVFFVISGFLITSIISHDLNNNTFSIQRFYRNRIKRIFPSLLTVLFAVAIFSWVALFAEEFKKLGLHYIGAATFSTNFILNHESGYFDSASILKPLLHLWSLAIEEQFYIFWPILLWTSFKATKRYLVIFWLLFLSSFLLQFHEQLSDMTAAFYLPQFRFWELLSGSLLALGLKNHQLRPSFLAELIALTGLSLILAGAMFYCQENTKNIYILLFPILGTLLVIISPSTSYINHKILSNKWMVAIGLISYPLYLWHWPILSLDKIIFNVDDSIYRQLLLVLLSLILAVLTYYFVERPVRFFYEKKSKYMVLILLMILVAVFGWRVYDRNGYPHRSGTFEISKSGEIGNDSFVNYIQKNYSICSPESLAELSEKFQGIPRCYQSKNSAKDIAIIGDSHAEQLFPGIAQAFPDKNVFYINRGDLPQVRSGQYQKLIEAVANDAHISSVYFSLFWFKKLNAGVSKAQFVQDFNQVVSRLKKSGKEVYLIDDAPYFSFDAKECKYIRAFGRTKCQEQNYFAEGRKKYLVLLEEIGRLNHIQIVNLSRYFCHDVECSMALGSEILYRDDNHLNVRGSIYLGSKLKEAGLI